MFSSTLPDPFLAWEGEAPAEPWRIKLGRSLALPLVSNAFDIAKMFRAVPSPSRPTLPGVPWRDPRDQREGRKIKRCG